MKRVGIFGGSFNPIHVGHIELARQMRRLAGLDEVWLMVSPQNPLKRQDDLLNEALRLDMARRALCDEEGIVASDYEMRLPRPSYTWNTLCHLSADYPDHTFTLLIGGDNWQLFHRWRHADDILARYPIVVYPRPGSLFPTEGLPSTVTVVETPLLDVSSTQVRHLVAEGKSVDGLVPPAIVALVEHHYAAQK